MLAHILPCALEVELLTMLESGYEAIEGAPTVEHGREVVRAAELEHAGERREARVVASECEATARERLGAGEGGVR